MALAKCVYCGVEQEDYLGTYLIKNDGTNNYYCSSKCKKNHLKLGRDKRRMKWTSAFRESQHKRLESEKKAHAKAHAETKVKK